MRLRALTVPLLILALAGCAVSGPPTAAVPSSVPTPSETVTVGEPTGEDFLVVRSTDTELRLAPVPIANDPAPVPEDTPSLTGDEIFVFVRPVGWTLSALQFTGATSSECGEWTYDAVVTDLGGGWSSVRPVGPAGDYHLALQAGSGPGLPAGGEVGEMQAFIGWTTTRDAPQPEAETNMTVTRYDEESGEVEFSVYGMSVMPQTASAEITLSGESGESLTVALDQVGCIASGSVGMYVDLDESQITALGSGLYAYAIILTIDGVEYRASGTEDTGTTTSPAFTPALP